MIGFMWPRRLIVSLGVLWGVTIQAMEQNEPLMSSILCIYNVLYSYIYRLSISLPIQWRH